MSLYPKCLSVPLLDNNYTYCHYYTGLNDDETWTPASIERFVRAVSMLSDEDNPGDNPFIVAHRTEAMFFTRGFLASAIKGDLDPKSWMEIAEIFKKYEGDIQKSDFLSSDQILLNFLTEYTNSVRRNIEEDTVQASRLNSVRTILQIYISNPNKLLAKEGETLDNRIQESLRLEAETRNEVGIQAMQVRRNAERDAMRIAEGQAKKSVWAKINQTVTDVIRLFEKTIKGFSIDIQATLHAFNPTKTGEEITFESLPIQALEDLHRNLIAFTKNAVHQYSNDIFVIKYHGTSEKRIYLVGNPFPTFTLLPTDILSPGDHTASAHLKFIQKHLPEVSLVLEHALETSWTPPSSEDNSPALDSSVKRAKTVVAPLPVAKAPSQELSSSQIESSQDIFQPKPNIDTELKAFQERAKVCEDFFHDSPIRFIARVEKIKNGRTLSIKITLNPTLIERCSLKKLESLNTGINSMNRPSDPVFFKVYSQIIETDFYALLKQKIMELTASHPNKAEENPLPPETNDSRAENTLLIALLEKISQAETINPELTREVINFITSASEMDKSSKAFKALQPNLIQKLELNLKEACEAGVEAPILGLISCYQILLNEKVLTKMPKLRELTHKAAKEYLNTRWLFATNLTLKTFFRDHLNISRPPYREQFLLAIIALGSLGLLWMTLYMMQGHQDSGVIAPQVTDTGTCLAPPVIGANGESTYTWDDGATFVGIIENGQRIEGKMIEINGDTFQGKYKNNQPSEGTGIWHQLNRKFEGTFENGGPKNGTLYFANGDIFIGEIRDGLPYKGRKIYAKGDIFEGEFDDGNKVNGKLFFRSGEIFEGEFDNNKPSNGKLTWANGNSYEGKFKDGQPTSDGIYTSV